MKKNCNHKKIKFCSFHLSPLPLSNHRCRHRLHCCRHKTWQYVKKLIPQVIFMNNSTVFRWKYIGLHFRLQEWLFIKWQMCIICPSWNCKCCLILRWACWSPPSSKCFFSSWCVLPAVACGQSVTAAADDINNSESLLPTAMVATKRNYGIKISSLCCKCAFLNSIQTTIFPVNITMHVFCVYNLWWMKWDWDAFFWWLYGFSVAVIISQVLQIHLLSGASIIGQFEATI